MGDKVIEAVEPTDPKKKKKFKRIGGTHVRFTPESQKKT